MNVSGRQDVIRVIRCNDAMSKWNDLIFAVKLIRFKLNYAFYSPVSSVRHERKADVQIFHCSHEDEMLWCAFIHEISCCKFHIHD